MFDNTPPNLPVDGSANVPPTPPEAPTPPQPPRAPDVMRSAPRSAANKDPEDIFAGMDDKGSSNSEVDIGPTSEPAPRSPAKLILTGLIVLLVLGGIGLGVWAYVVKSSVGTNDVAIKNTPEPVATQPIVEAPPVVAPSETVPVTLPPSGSNIPTPEVATSVASETPEVASNPVPPPIVVAEGADSDGDGLTDSEEGLFGTNAQATDSDKDGYLDGAELKSGYDPASPKSALSLSKYLKPFFIGQSWTVLLSKIWSLSTAEDEIGTVVIGTGASTTFAIHAETAGDTNDLTAWIAKYDPQIDESTLVSFKTKAGEQARQTPDHLVTYILSGDTVLVIRYQLNGATTYEDRAIYEHLIQTIKRR